MSLIQRIQRLTDRLQKIGAGVIEILTLRYDGSKFTTVNVKITLEKNQICSLSEIEIINKNVSVLVELLNNPAPDRYFSDFEDE